MNDRIQVEDQQLLLNNKGQFFDYCIEPLLIWVFVQIEYVDVLKNEEDFIQLELTYKDGCIYVLSGDCSSSLDQFSVDEDELIEFVRHLLDQQFLLDTFGRWYNYTEDKRYKEIIQLIETKSTKIQLDPKESKKLNKIRLRRITGVEDEWS